jgi:ParB family chromosome partitioning protein
MVTGAKPGRFTGGFRAPQTPQSAQPIATVDKSKRFDAAEEALFGKSGRGGAPVPGGAALAADDSARFAATSTDIVLNAPIEKVHDNDYNARTWYDPEIVKQRASEIAADGQKTPALAVPHPTIPGEFMLVEGHYRKRALLLLNRPTIKLILRSDWTTPQQRFVQSWKANEERLANSPIDNAIQWARVLDQGVVRNQEELAALLNVSETTVTRTIAIASLPATALEMARKNQGVFTTSLLYELTLVAKSVPDQNLESLMDRVQGEGWSRRDVETFKAKHAQPTNRKPKETSRQHKILNEGAQIGVIKDWDNGRVLLDVKVSDPAAREQLVNELRKRFGLDTEAQITLKP